VLRVVLSPRPSSWGFGTKSSEVGAYVSPGSSSRVIGTGVMHEAYDPSSSSYMVIKSMSIVGISVPLDALIDIC
jgi:hypothetical protein